MIRPEDIPDELIEKLVRPRKSDDWKQQIADDLNVMIEEGVVSPPCHVLRHEDGTLKGDRDGAIWVGAGKARFSIFEHYRGQTE